MIPANCDVRRILLNVVPGAEGMGHEVYAKSTAEVVEKLCQLSSELEEWQIGIRRFRPAWMHPDTAPKDGRLLRLQVQFTANQMDDDDKVQETIGHNCRDNTGLDLWQFAGWNWSHDCFTQGEGTVVGWLPFSE